MRIISCAINDTSPPPGVEEARLMDSRGGEVSLMAQEIILIFFVVKSAQTAKELF